MNKTKISYLSHTWNPIAMRCTPISAGCANCWHLAMAKRLAKNLSIHPDYRNAYAGGAPVLDEKELGAPFHLKKPARIGVQFMGDLFHEDLPNFVSSIWSTMKRCPHHIFFVLTKRPEGVKEVFDYTLSDDPLPNVWLGVSVENQKTADERIPILLQIPAAHHWISIEPMLNEVDLDEYLWKFNKNYQPPRFFDEGETYNVRPTLPSEEISWIVLGGETGPHARPLHLAWARSIRDQCRAAAIPFFFKSWGGRSGGCLIDGQEYKEMP